MLETDSEPRIPILPRARRLICPGLSQWRLMLLCIWAGETALSNLLLELRDGFKLNLPQANFNFAKVFTTKDLDEVYAWDKGQGIVYVMNKDGEFVNQISSDILSKGSDIVVYNKSIYVLLDSKIFKIE